MTEDYQKQIVEALIIASDTPISENKIVGVIEDEITPGKIKKMVDELNESYSQSQRGFFIARVGGGYQFNTRQDLAPWLKKLYKGKIKARLSQASLESLAIIVFKQPISRVEVDSIRGVNSGGVLKNLLERNLITIAGRSSGPGKPLLYGTTREFLTYMGINDISDLPKPKEIAEIMGKLDAGEGIADDILAALAEIDNEGEDEPVEAESTEEAAAGNSAEQSEDGANGKHDGQA